MTLLYTGKPGKSSGSNGTVRHMQLPSHVLAIQVVAQWRRCDSSHLCTRNGNAAVLSLHTSQSEQSAQDQQRTGISHARLTRRKTQTSDSIIARQRNRYGTAEPAASSRARGHAGSDPDVGGQAALSGGV